MSSSESRVTIQIDEPSAELRVIDARFHVVQRGIGTSSFSLAPGVYKVQASAAGSQVEQLFAVHGDGRPERVDLPPIRFRSAAPLDSTSTSHEYHQAAVSRASNRTPVDVGLGKGSTLLLVVRDPGSACIAQRTAAPEARARYRRSFEGFSLHGSNREPPIELQRVGECDPDLGYFTAQVQLAPGHYTLTHQAPEAPAVAMPVFASARCHPQIFANIQIDEDLNQPGKPDLRERALILGPPQRHFDPHDPVLRASEIARRAYSQRRFALAETILDGYLSCAEEAPIIGLFGAQLALQAPPDKRVTSVSKWHAVLSRLESELGADFPDVVALALALDPDSRRQVVSHPPLLRASWNQLQRHPHVHPELFQLLLRANSVGTWLSWLPLVDRTEQERTPPEAARSLVASLSRHFQRSEDPIRSFGGVLHSLEHKRDDNAKQSVPALLPQLRDDAMRGDPQTLLDLTQDIVASEWFDVALSWLRKNAASSYLAANLTGLQATLLASLELARSRRGEETFGAEDLQALIDGLNVSPSVVNQSLVQLRELLILAWAAANPAPL